MITFNIQICNCEYPVTISMDDLLLSLLENKGKLIELIAKAVVKFKKDDSDVVKMQLNEIVKLIEK